jgi:RimJ/RimL family protein N-acetyltransferase
MSDANASRPPDFGRRVRATFDRYKNHYRPDMAIAIVDEAGATFAQFAPVQPTHEHARLLAAWRNAAPESFFTWFTATEAGVIDWIERAVIRRLDRILFMVETLGGIPVGHMGLTNFDFRSGSCELDYVLRGRKDLLPGVMRLAYKRLTEWALDELGASRVVCRVFEDNSRPIALLREVGYVLTARVPLVRKEEGDRTLWVEAPDGSGERHYLVYTRSARAGAAASSTVANTS